MIDEQSGAGFAQDSDADLRTAAAIPDDGRRFIGKVTCATCNRLLNETNPLREREKMLAGISAPMFAGKCPKGCRSTFSDLNLNIEIEWSEVPPTKQTT